jgi:hypothetical protein
VEESEDLMAVWAVLRFGHSAVPRLSRFARDKVAQLLLIGMPFAIIEYF